MGLKKTMSEKPGEYMKTFIDHLGKSLLEDLRTEIPKHLETLIDVRFKGIKDGMEALGRIESTQREQADMIENLQLSYKHLNDEFEAFRKRMQPLPQEVKETIEKTMDDRQNQIVDVIATELEQIPTKPSKPVTVPKKKKRFIFF